MSKSERAAGLAAMMMAAASGIAAAQVVVSDPWVRGTVAGQTATGAYMQITSATDAALVGVSSPIAKVAGVHEMKLDGPLMKMGAVPKLPLPAGKQVDLKPGGYHVMLMQLTQPVTAGAMVPLTLTIVDRSGHSRQVEVRAVVRPLGAAAPVAR